MRALGVLRALGPIDLKNVGRDSLMRWMAALPLVLALAFRWGLPPVERWAVERFGVSLDPYQALIASFLVMATPIMYGAVIGFLLLDQKDDRTLTALQVTPLTTAGYLVYRMAIPMALSVVITPVVLQLAGLATLSLPRQLLAAVGAAPLGPGYAVFVAAFARNKVQGFALVKGAGVLNWPPVIAYFVHSDWQWAFGLCPTYWPVKLYWEIDAGGSLVWPVFLAGMLYFGLLIAWMLRRFDREIHR